MHRITEQLAKRYNWKPSLVLQVVVAKRKTMIHNNYAQII